MHERRGRSDTSERSPRRRPLARPQFVIDGFKEPAARDFVALAPSLIDQRRVRWQNRSHFFAIAGHVMRRILVDHARARLAAKGGPDVRVPLEGVDVATASLDIDILALDAALERLASVDRRQSELVELRFFAGLTVDEMAAALEVSPITVKRDWALARAWLFRELKAS